MMQETKQDLLKDLRLAETMVFPRLEEITDAGLKYIRDLRINLKNALKDENLTTKEAYLIALAVVINEKNDVLTNSFRELATEHGATPEELAEVGACVSLLAKNNILYRFRHFVGKESYYEQPARIKMTLMMKPILGKAFFELVSLAVSALNGCEACVKSHEKSVLDLGVSEQKIFASIRLTSVVKGLNVLFVV